MVYKFLEMEWFIPESHSAAKLLIWDMISAENHYQ